MLLLDCATAYSPGHVTIRKTAPAYFRVAERLRAQILSGRLIAGERLPSEDDLASRYDVSRSTVREALRQLSSQGLLTTNRGVQGGSRVALLDPAEVAEMLTLGITLLSQFEQVTVRQLLEAREHLEVPATRLAAQHRTREDLISLEQKIVPIRRGQDNREAFEANRAFHGAVLRASGNAMLELLAEPLFRVLQSRFLREGATSAFWTRVVKEHREIFGAIKKGDAAAAGRLMDRHLAGLRTTYEQIDVRHRRAARPKAS